MVKPIEEVYPDFTRWGVYDYTPLLESWDYSIVIRVDEANYQGDSWLLLYNEGTKQFGYLQFGWGSCSGCDSLQACSTLQEVDELRQELHDSIKWGTGRELLEYFQTHDWEGDYGWHSEEKRDFVRRATDYLSRITKS